MRQLLLSEDPPSVGQGCAFVGREGSAFVGSLQLVEDRSDVRFHLLQPIGNLGSRTSAYFE